MLIFYFKLRNKPQLFWDHVPPPLPLSRIISGDRGLCVSPIRSKLSQLRPAPVDHLQRLADPAFSTVQVGLWYKVRPPFDSVQLVNITPMSLWFMVRK